MDRLIATAIVIPACTLPTSGASTLPFFPIFDIVSVYNDLNMMCRGWSGDDPHTDEACAVLEKVGRLY